MTNEEAIVIMENERPHCGESITFTEEEKCEAFDMVIEALKAQPCKDAISRQEVIDTIDKWVKAKNILETLPTDKVTPLFKSVHKLPPVIPKPRMGKWVSSIIHEDRYAVECSECGYKYEGFGTNYCPHCGAKMGGESE